MFQGSTVPTVDVIALPEGATVFDVREDDEWAAGHVPGATHVALGEVVARVSEFAGADAPVHVICRSGGRSGRAVEYLVEQGVDAVNVAGGMQAWAAAGKAMDSEDGAAPRVI